MKKPFHGSLRVLGSQFLRNQATGSSSFSSCAPLTSFSLFAPRPSFFKTIALSPFIFGTLSNYRLNSTQPSRSVLSPEEQTQADLDRVKTFAARTGLTIKDPQLFLQSLTHASFVNKQVDNSHLEFFGDRLLNFIVADYIFHKYPTLPATALVDASMLFCNNNTLYEVAKKLGLPEFVRYTAPSEDDDRHERKVMTDAVEALLAAIYYEQGLAGARAFILTHILPSDNFDIIPFLRQKYPKKTLADLLKRRGSGLPYFEILQESGRHSHKSTYLVGVFSDGKLLAQGNGRSISAAETDAAQEALNKIWGKNAYLQLPSDAY